jgi:hypothetical protein
MLVHRPLEPPGRPTSLTTLRLYAENGYTQDSRPAQPSRFGIHVSATPFFSNILSSAEGEMALSAFAE